MTEDVRHIFAESRQTYGTRRIKKKLALQGMIISRRRVGRLMREADLQCETKRKFKATTCSRHIKEISPNLLESRFDVDHMNQYWVGKPKVSAEQKNNLCGYQKRLVLPCDGN